MIITSYESCIRAKSKLSKLFFSMMVIDEAHRIKNERTILSKHVKYIQSNFRLLLTGTPMQNTLHELWSLLNFIFPEVFTNSDHFDQHFNLVETKGKELMTLIHQLH